MLDDILPIQKARQSLWGNVAIAEVVEVAEGVRQLPGWAASSLI
ncbi:MAG: hypothetical protein R3C05_03060 [Pirellulaceae bacterium]